MNETPWHSSFKIGLSVFSLNVDNSDFQFQNLLLFAHPPGGTPLYGQ